MDNETLLLELKRRLETGEIQPEVVRALLPANQSAIRVPQAPRTAASTTDSLTSRFKFHFSLTKVLYVIGGALVTLGLIYFGSQIWDDIGSLMRILITLGVGLVLAGMGSWLMVAEPAGKLGVVFHAIGGFFIPGGAMVMLSELSRGVHEIGPVMLTIGVIAAFYIALALYHRHVVLSFFAVANFTAWLYLLIETILPGRYYEHVDFYAYVTMAIGVGYILLAQASKTNWNRLLARPLLFVGSAGFYYALFTQIDNLLLIEIAYPFVVLGGLVLAHSTVKSRSIQFTSTFALISYFIYVMIQTGDSWWSRGSDLLEWMYALITIGVGLGYVIINRYYRYREDGKFAHFLQFFGSGFFFLTAFVQIFNSTFMEVVFPFVAIAGVVTSVLYMKSRIILVMSTLAIIAYTIYISSEYFADSLGWPVVLIILGFIIIGLGYYSINLSKKYLS